MKTSSSKDNDNGDKSNNNNNLAYITQYLNTVSSTTSKTIIRQDKDRKDKRIKYKVFYT